MVQEHSFDAHDVAIVSQMTFRNSPQIKNEAEFNEGFYSIEPRARLCSSSSTAGKMNVERTFLDVVVLLVVIFSNLRHFLVHDDCGLCGVGSSNDVV